MIGVHLDTSGMEATMRDLARRVMPEVTAQALNRTAEEVQARAQHQLHLSFALRTPQSATFMERLIKIMPGDRATPKRLEAGVRIEGPRNAPARAQILTKHIKGGAQSARDPMQPIYIPTRALRPSRHAVVPRNMYPKNLRIFERGAPSGTLPAKGTMSKRGKPLLKGKRRTFALPNPAGRLMGIYQRWGPGRAQVSKIYTLKSAITLKARYPFPALTERVANERLGLNWQGFMDAALRKLGVAD